LFADFYLRNKYIECLACFHTPLISFEITKWISYLPVQNSEHLHQVVAGGGPLDLVVVTTRHVLGGVKCQVRWSSMNLNKTPKKSL
jgi:hypothetical protein